VLTAVPHQLVNGNSRVLQKVTLCCYFLPSHTMHTWIPHSALKNVNNANYMTENEYATIAMWR